MYLNKKNQRLKAGLNTSFINLVSNSSDSSSYTTINADNNGLNIINTSGNVQSGAITLDPPVSTSNNISLTEPNDILKQANLNLNINIATEGNSELLLAKKINNLNVIQNSGIVYNLSSANANLPINVGDKMVLVVKKNTNNYTLESVDSTLLGGGTDDDSNKANLSLIDNIYINNNTFNYNNNNRIGISGTYTQSSNGNVMVLDSSNKLMPSTISLNNLAVLNTSSLVNYSTTTSMNTAISTALSVYSTTSAMNTAISTALSVYSTTVSMNNAISTALSVYSTTTSMNSAISTALIPYATTSAMNTALNSYATTASMNTAISTALNVYSTTSAMNTAISTALNVYSTTASMNSAISTALSVYSTTTSMNSAISTALIPYATTSAMNTAISTALSVYSTTASMNSAISTALIPYATTSAMNTALNSYLTSANAASTYLTSATAVSTYMVLSGSNANSAANTWSGINTFNSGKLALAGNGGNLTLNASQTVSSAAYTLEYPTAAPVGTMNVLTTSGSSPYSKYTWTDLSTYLTQSTAASTYLTSATAASTYLTSATAASTYDTLNSAKTITGNKTFDYSVCKLSLINATNDNTSSNQILLMNSSGNVVPCDKTYSLLNSTLASGALTNVANTFSAAQTFNNGNLVLNGTGANNVTLNAPSTLASSYTWNLPLTNPSSGTTNVLCSTSTVSPYNLSWVDLNTIFLTQSVAASTYLTSATAASTYLTSATATSTYLTSATAASTYLTSVTAASTYMVLSGTNTNSAANTWSGVNTFNSGKLVLAGNGGNLTVNASQTASSSAYTLEYPTVAPGGTMNVLTTSGSSPYSKYTWTDLSTYLTSATAASTYLTSATAASTYLTQANATSTYLTSATAASTYLTSATAASTYMVLSGTNTNSAANTWSGVNTFNSGKLVLAGNGGNLTVNASQTASSSAYTLEYPTVAPGGTMNVLTTSGSSPYSKYTWTDLSTYLTSATAASTYLTQANATSTYLTQTNATSTYLTQTNATSTYGALSAANAWSGINTYNYATAKLKLTGTTNNTSAGSQIVVMDSNGYLVPSDKLYSSLSAGSVTTNISDLFDEEFSFESGVLATASIGVNNKYSGKISVTNSGGSIATDSKLNYFNTGTSQTVFIMTDASLNYIYGNSFILTMSCWIKWTAAGTSSGELDGLGLYSTSDWSLFTMKKNSGNLSFTYFASDSTRPEVSLSSFTSTNPLFTIANNLNKWVFLSVTLNGASGTMSVYIRSTDSTLYAGTLTLTKPYATGNAENIGRFKFISSTNGGVQIANYFMTKSALTNVQVNMLADINRDNIMSTLASSTSSVITPIYLFSMDNTLLSTFNNYTLSGVSYNTSYFKTGSASAPANNISFAAVMTDLNNSSGTSLSICFWSYFTANARILHYYPNGGVGNQYVLTWLNYLGGNGAEPTHRNVFSYFDGTGPIVGLANPDFTQSGNWNKWWYTVYSWDHTTNTIAITITDGITSYTNSNVVTNSTYITKTNTANRAFFTSGSSSFINASEVGIYMDNVAFYNVALTSSQITALSKNANGNSFLKIGGNTFLGQNFSLV